MGPGLTVTGTTVAVFEADDRGEGSASVMPMRAFSRATTWARSRIIETLTFSPSLVCRLYETANLKCPPSTGGGPLLGELLNPRVGGTSYDIEFFASDRSGKGEVAESLRFCPTTLLRGVESPGGGLGELSEAPKDALFRPSD